MSEPEQYVITEITIRRILIGDDDVVQYEAADSQGEVPPLIEVLGLLRLAEDSAIREAMGEDE